MNRAELTEKYFELVGYMVTSARNLLDESPLYGPFRLVDAASRLVAIMEEDDLADQRLLAIRKEIEAHKYSVMEDPTKFRQFLDSLVDLLVSQIASSPGRGGGVYREKLSCENEGKPLKERRKEG